MQWEKDLTAILDFWLKNGVDYNNGGIYTCVDSTGLRYGSEKSVWFQGRALWSFSKAYNVIDRNSEYLKAAENIYQFLSKCTDTDGRMFFTVTAEGKELQKRRYYFSETFAAIGCAEYYKATGRKDVLKAAEDYFTVAYECFKGIRKTEPKINPENNDMKVLSPLMIMLSTSQTMRSIPGLWSKYASIVEECMFEIMHGGFLTEKGLMENVDKKGRFVDSPSGRIVNPGHSMEAAWFVISEGILTDNKEAINFGKKVIDITLPLGWDKKYGGIIAFTDVDGKPPVQLEWDMKLWWPQCETMIAARLAYMLFEENKYKKLYEDLKEYCKQYFYDEHHGEWYGYLHYDNSVSTTLKGNIFKGPFHIPRLYMIMAIMDETGNILKFME